MMSKATGEGGKRRRDADLIRAGNQMANVFFNYKQKFGEMLITNEDRAMYAQLQEGWDNAKTKYRQSFKRKIRRAAVRP